MKFDELYWHDSELNGIVIDRKNPGQNDSIVLEINWHDIGPSKLIFEGVLWCRLSLNFGIIVRECLDSGLIAEESDADLMAFRERWKGVKSKESICYIVRTISTGSEIKIIAKDFALVTQ